RLVRLSIIAGLACRLQIPPLKKGDTGGFVRMTQDQIPPDLPFSKGGTHACGESRQSLAPEWRVPRSLGLRVPPRARLVEALGGVFSAYRLGVLFDHRQMEVKATMSREAILDADLPIIDPHHHLWDRPASLLGQLPPSDHGFMEIIRR